MNTMIALSTLIKRWFVFYLFIGLSPLHANWSSSPTTLDNQLPSPNASSPAYLVADTIGNVTAGWLENTDEGTVVEAAYYSINSGTWSTPTIIDQDNAGATPPRLIVDQSGIVTAVWLEYLGGSYLVQAARFDGTTWTPPVTLDNGAQSPNAYYYFSPQLVVDTVGNVTVVWLEQQESSYAVQAARFSDGSWTSSPTTLDGQMPNAYANIFPGIVVDKFGNVTVVWFEQQGSSYAVQAARFSQGSWTTVPATLDGPTPNAYSNLSPQMIVDELGNVTVTWLENLESSVGVEAARFSAGVWAAAVILDNGIQTPNTSSSAFIVADSVGNVTAGWLENTDAGTTVEAAYYSINSDTWSPPTIIDQDSSAATPPQLVVDQSGIVTAVWLEYIGSYAVQAARFNGTTWTPPVILDNGIQSPRANLSLPLINVDLAGNVTVVWFEQPESNYAVQAARFSNGSWTSSPVTLDGPTPNANINTSFQTIVDAFGDVTVTWVENLESSLAIEAARFSADAWAPAVILDNGTQTPDASANTVLQLVEDGAGNVTVTWLENSVNPEAVQVARFQNFFPPANLTGYQQLNQFLLQEEYVNILQWNPPAVGETPIAYRIYRDASLTDLAGMVYYTGNPQLEFFDYSRKKGVPYSYYIVSVSAQGNVSEPASIVVG